MSLSSGRRLGPYEVVAPIGAGGMGEVYRARDSKLGRDVALKVLPANLAGDTQYMARFQREAQVLASLNHPHIASIYGLEESGGVRALVMELVEGPTLADRIKKGPVPLKEALEIAKQIAEALEYAHEKGVIHRDLKPANVKLTPEGTVKVLDFGLAKAAEQPTESKEWEDAATLPASMSRPGVILGTAAYMAPEQARGEEVDKRADIWAFGVVLWEMLCGRRLFGGGTTSETLADVLRAELDFDKLPASTPISIRRLLRRCLERELRNRLQAIGDARLEIEEYQADPIGAVLPARVQLLPWVVSTTLLVALAVLALVHFRQSPPESSLVKYSIPPPDKKGYVHVAPSPDGRLLAFVAVDSVDQNQLWLRRLDTLDAQPLAGTAGALLPFWSPDSRFVGFWADGKLKKVDVGTPFAPGPSQTLCDAGGLGGATWSHEGVIVFGVGSGLYRVPASGGEIKAVTSLDPSRKERTHYWPWFLPDGRHYLYTVVSEQRENSGIYLGSLDSPDRTRLVGDLSNAVYVKAPAQGGYVLFVREGTLMAQRFDAKTLQLTDDALPVARQVNYSTEWAEGSFAVSENGMLVFLDSRRSIDATQLTWFDRTGRRLGTVGERGRYGWRPQLSQDNKQVAVDLRDPATLTSDIWLIDLAREISSRFTFDPADDTVPVWSPNGKRIIFNSNRGGAYDLYERDIGGGKEELLLKSGGNKWANSWSPDGRFLLYCERDPKTLLDLWVLPLTGDKTPFPFRKTEFREADASFSPDGKWVAYESSETDQSEIYVEAFSGMQGGHSVGTKPEVRSKWRISNGGGKHARWRRDSAELFYGTDDGQIMAAEIKAVPTFRAGVPQLLFEARFTRKTLISFAVTADGQRFLIPTPVEISSAPATVVLNWTRELKQ